MTGQASADKGARFLLGLAGVAIAFAALSYHVVEKPFMKMRVRYLRPPAGTPANETSTSVV